MARRVGGVMTVADPSSRDTSCGATKAHSCGWGGWVLFCGVDVDGCVGVEVSIIDNQKQNAYVRKKKAKRLPQTIKMYIIFIIYIYTLCIYLGVASGDVAHEVQQLQEARRVAGGAHGEKLWGLGWVGCCCCFIFALDLSQWCRVGCWGAGSPVDRSTHGRSHSLTDRQAHVRTPQPLPTLASARKARSCCVNSSW